MRSKELVHVGAEGCVVLTQNRNLARSQAGAPLEPVANGRLLFEEIGASKIAAVQARGFRGLDRCEDFNGIRPPVRIDASPFQPESLKIANEAVKAGDDFRLAVLKKAVGDEGEAHEAVDRCSLHRRKRRCQKGCVFEVAKEPAHRIERFSEMSAAAPITAAD